MQVFNFTKAHKTPILILLISFLGFIATTLLINNSALEHFDVQLKVVLSQIITADSASLTLFITSLGSVAATAIIATATILLLILKKEKKKAALLFIAGLITAVLVVILKELFAIPRPELPFVIESSLRFPSGHAASALYSSLCGLTLLSAYSLRGHSEYVLKTLLFIFPLVIGVSRLLLNVHKLIDIIAGYLVSIITFTLTYLLLQLFLKHQLE